MPPKAPPLPKVTREYLLAHGFKESADDPATFVREHAPLCDVLRDLNVPLKSFHPVVNQPDHSDLRTAVVNGVFVIIRSEVRDEDGNVIVDSLDKPNAICTTEVCFQGPERTYLKTDSSPRLRINSVMVPEDRSQGLQITFQLAADGKTPLAILRDRICLCLTARQQPPAYVLVSFPKDVPEHIVVLPGQPLTFVVSASTNELTGGRWSDLPSGEYAATISISEEGKQQSAFDYNWIGETYSDGYKIVIK